MLHLSSTLSKNPNNGRFFLIAIDGRGASGKSTLTSYLKTLLPDFTYIFYDDYFEPAKSAEIWGAFNRDRFESDVVGPLQQSNRFTYRPYAWHTRPNIAPRDITVGKGLVLEGCFSFSFRLDWDLKIWVETPRQLCLKRGIERDTKNVGYQKAVRGWRDIWLPPEDEYISRIQPLKTADIVLDGAKPFELQIA